MPVPPASTSAWMRRTCAALLLGAALFASGGAMASGKTHVVQSGQRLGSIAKRYNVSIEAICEANGIRRTDKIFPGQKLVIPEPGKPGSSKGKSSAPAPTAAQKGSTSKGSPSKTAPKTGSAKAATAEKSATNKGGGGKTKGYGHPLVHVVAKGQTLGAIARRYGVTVQAICHASGITERSVLKIGQQLLVPATTDPEGEHARSLRVSGRLDPSIGYPTWEKYSKAPARRGYVTLQGHSHSWKGLVFGPGQKLLPQARTGIAQVLGARAGGPAIDEKLIRLMTQVSDQFGGRPLRIVSGYRETSYVHDSKHKVGRALDFSIPGVPNEVVRDYCRTLGSVGVGYYPNSTFVHLDVRPSPAYWVDYAGPGEPPRLTPYPPRNSANATARLSRDDRGKLGASSSGQSASGQGSSAQGSSAQGAAPSLPADSADATTAPPEEAPSPSEAPRAGTSSSGTSSTGTSSSSAAGDTPPEIGH